MTYLMILSVARILLRLANNELVRKVRSVVVYNWRYSPDFCLEVRKSITKICQEPETLSEIRTG
jgi:hypothetical protein